MRSPNQREERTPPMVLMPLPLLLLLLLLLLLWLGSGWAG